MMVGISNIVPECKSLDPPEAVPAGRDDPIGGVDQPLNRRVGEQASRAWTQGLGQRPAQRRAGGVDGAVGGCEMQGSAAFGCREWG